MQDSGAISGVATQPETDAIPVSDSSSIANGWAGFIESTRYGSLPAHVVELAKGQVLDCLATAIEAKGLPVPEVAMKFIGANQGAATIIGHSRKVPGIDAAFVNATLVNGCTHDDFLYKSHAGAVTLPAALAAAEEHGASGRDLIVSLVVGYEVVARTYLGGPTMLPRFRATGVAGAVGAAASAGKLLKLNRTELANALGCAAMFASGFGEGFKTGSMDVKLNVGWAARSGLSAAQLAAYGATSSPTVFEGESGFYRAFSNSVGAVTAALEGLGNRYLIEDTVYKELPVCIFVQTPVYLAATLMRTEKLDPAKIDRMTITAPEATLTNPGYTNIAPFETQLKARISARFTAAAALLGRPVDTYDYYYNTRDQDVLALAEKIELLEPGADQEGRVDLAIYSEGRCYQLSGKELDTLRPSLQKTIAKFRRLTMQHPKDWADRLLEAVLNLENLRDIRGLTALLQTP